VNATEEAEIPTPEVVDDFVRRVVLHRVETHPVDVLRPESTIVEGGADRFDRQLEFGSARTFAELGLADSDDRRFILETVG
jgi:hypothetical protein